MTTLGRGGSDTTAVALAAALKADRCQVFSDVKGIYTADPMTTPTASRYESLSYLEVLERGLKVMDATAISLCMDNKLPIIVFRLRDAGNLRRVIMGEPVGTTVRA